MPLGKTVKALRQKQALNQKALAALSGVSQATISRIETGRVQQLRSSALKSIADALGVSADFLMGDSKVFADVPGSGTGGSRQEAAIPGVREDRFRQIADVLEAFVVHDQGRILYVNQKFAEVMGYRTEELLGKNGVMLLVAPRSHSVLYRMMNSSSQEESCEVLLMRKDGSLFPGKVVNRELTETVHLAILRDVTCQRTQQACARVLLAGLEAHQVDDVPAVVRIMADELEDMGVPFTTAGVHVIHEARNRLFTALAFPESRGYGDFHRSYPLRESEQRYSIVRGLVSCWRRRKIWEHDAGPEFEELIQEGAKKPGCQPLRYLLDVPFEQGMLTLGMHTEEGFRLDDLVGILEALAPALSSVLGRLFRAEELLQQLEAAQSRTAENLV